MEICLKSLSKKYRNSLTAVTDLEAIAEVIEKGIKNTAAATEEAIEKTAAVHVAEGIIHMAAVTAIKAVSIAAAKYLRGNLVPKEQDFLISNSILEF